MDNLNAYMKMLVRMNENFNLIHYTFDHRGDDGDDGGYMITISEKENVYYLHVLYINYEYDYHIIDDSETVTNRKYGKWEDIETYLKFDSVDAAYNYLIKLIYRFDSMILTVVNNRFGYEVYEYEEIMEYDDDYCDEWFMGKFFSEIEDKMLQTISFPYSEFRDKDLESIINIRNYTFDENDLYDVIKELKDE